MKKNIYLIGFLFILGIIYIVFEFNKLGDFKVFLDAGQLLKEKRNIYLYNELNNFKYYYSPLFAVFISIFSKNYLIAVILWKIINLFFIFRIWKIIEENFLNFSVFSSNQKAIFLLSSFLISFLFISKNLHMAQMTLFLLYAILEGLNLILYKQKYLFGAILIATAINIKIMPIVILPYLIYRKELKSSLYIIITLFIFILLPALFIGIEYNTFLHSEWWKSINPLNQEHIIDVNERGFHSLSTFFGVLFSDELGNEHNLQIKRNIANFTPEIISYILNIVRFILIAFTLKILNTLPFKKAADKFHTFYEISYILLITPLIFPHQQIYGFIFIIPALIYVLYCTFIEVISKKGINFKNGLFAFSFLIMNSIIIFGFMRDILYHFKIMTYGIIFFLIIFILYSDFKIGKYLTNVKFDKEIY